MSQPNPEFWSPESEQDWKQEVNRRLAEHKYRRGIAAVAPSAPAPPPHPSNGSRAAQAAARVAARYSKAPSYSEMQAAEARTVVRAAEIATQVALEAQAAAEAVLANLDAAAIAPDTREKKPPRTVRPAEPFLKLEAAPAAPPESAQNPFQESKPAKKAPTGKKTSVENQAIGILWEPDMPVRTTETPIAHVQRENSRFEIPVEDWWESAPTVDEADAVLEPVEPAQPIFANLIEFPSELVATRKVRPRLAEGPNSAGPTDGQLSIFEVEPGAISIEPEISAAPVKSVGPEWSGMELDAQPTPQSQLEAEPARKAPVIELACLSRRLMAAVVDGSLIAGVFLAVAVEIAQHTAQLPALRVAEQFAAVGLFATAIIYLAIFSTLTASTPGMKYAGVSLCTFSDEFPTCIQRLQRLGALFLSLLPMGLGIVWGLFDEEHLSWHDRLSQTYQRKC